MASSFPLTVEEAAPDDRADTGARSSGKQHTSVEARAMLAPSALSGKFER
jgi:hypothetical protein